MQLKERLGKDVPGYSKIEARMRQQNLNPIDQQRKKAQSRDPVRHPDY